MERSACEKTADWRRTLERLKATRRLTPFEAVQLLRCSGTPPQFTEA